MKLSGMDLTPALKEMTRTGDPRVILIEYLGFEHARGHEIDKSRWPEEMKVSVKDARFVAEKAGFRVASVVVDDSIASRVWRAIAVRIIVDYAGLALVCVHDKGGQTWHWSSSSLQHRRSSAALLHGIRHLTVQLGEDGKAPGGFLELLAQIDVSEASRDLDVLKRVSDAFDSYTMDLQSDIAENAFEALRILSEGLLSNRENKLSRNIQTLEKIRPEVFIILYRILFVLYAEARDIFPVQHPVYYENYSLSWWRENVLLKYEKDSGSMFNEFGGPKGTDLWERCKRLFHLVMTGSRLQGHRPAEFDFRAYYGTIFDDELHESLEKWMITNEFLVPAIRQLTRFKEAGSTYFVDYSSFEVRQLGSIYEGLLEYHMAISKSGGVEHTMDEKERKASGSYFTPDWVIKEIVSSALNPLIEQISAEVGDSNPVEFENRLCSLRVCDPAMGSGHFLVGALEHLANAVLDYREKSGIPDAPGDEAIEVRRTLVRSCLYGVDLNPLAVELAKMSLWLETASSDRPLSFLDAHLKCGNSIIGTSFKALEDPQKSIFGEDLVHHLKKEVSDLISMERQEERDSEDVHQKVHKYIGIRSESTRYGRLSKLLNVPIASFFGVQVRDWRTARGLLSRPAEFDDFVSRGEWKKVDAIIDELGVFHWELEFPEVFFGENGEPRRNPGFDVVIGNPPYVNMQTMPALQMYCKENYVEIYTGQNDILYYFVLRGLDLVKKEGRLGYIVSRYFLESSYASKFREFMLRNSAIELIVDFNNFQVFGRYVNVLTSVLILRSEANESARKKNRVRVVRVNKWSKSGTELADSFLDKPEGYSDESIEILEKNQSALDNGSWTLSSPWVDKMRDKIGEDSLLLGQICDIGKGMETGLNEAFVIDEKAVVDEKIERKVLRNYVKTRDLQRFFPLRRNMTIIYLPEKTDEKEIQNALKHLSRWEPSLKSRYDYKKGNCQWYSWGNLRNRELFERDSEKIITPVYSTSNKFVYDSGRPDENYYTLTDTYVIWPKRNSKISLKYIIALLNSSLLEFYFKNTAKLKRDGYYEYSEGSLSKIPIKYNPEFQEDLERCVNRIIALRRSMSDSHSRKTKEEARLNNEIKNVEMEIENSVYSMYEIASEDRAIIEERTESPRSAKNSG